MSKYQGDPGGLNPYEDEYAIIPAGTDGGPSNPGGRWDDPVAQPTGPADDGMVDSPWDSNGTLIPNGGRERVTRDEFNRRGDLNIARNPGQKDPGSSGVPLPGGSSSSGGQKMPAPERYVPSPQDLELDETIMQGVRDAMSGKLNPFDPETIARMRAQSFQAAQGQGEQAKAAVSRDIASRGLGRSGIAVNQNASVDRATSAQVGKGMRDVLVTAAQENYKAKVSALERAQSYLDQRRQFALANLRSTQDYQIASSNINLGYARLAQEATNLEKQLKQALEIANMGNDTEIMKWLAQYGGY
jgi:hypothetical protein